MKIQTKKLHRELALRTTVNRIQIIGHLLLATICCFIVFYDLRYNVIVGQSMFPALRSDGRVFGVAPTDLKRGDIITVIIEDRLLVKRLIGLPGETIVLIENEIYINNHLIHEYYITNFPKYKKARFKIGLDEVFIMGDNRNISYDSRSFGPVKLSDIDGKVIWNSKW